MTKLFQSKDVILRRLVYLAIKELSTIADDVIIVTSRYDHQLNFSLFPLFIWREKINDPSSWETLMSSVPLSKLLWLRPLDT